jgi:UDP-glucose 4-epimerase
MNSESINGLNKRIFITGGAGFIGSHLVDRFMALGNRVVVFDNLSTGMLNNIEHHNKIPNFSFLEGNLLDEITLTKAMDGCELVFHMGGHADVTGGVANPRLDLENNTIATLNVLEAMKLNHIHQIIFASSSTVYGDTSSVPVPEHYGPLLPVSLYGASKMAAEALISAYCHIYDMQSWIFRFANIIGKRQRHGVIIDFIHKLRSNKKELEILGDGHQCKPYLHFSECVDGILFGYKHATEKVNIFNIGVESTTDVDTIARIIIHEMKLGGVKLIYTGGDKGWKGDIPKYRFNIDKIKSLGWQPKMTSDEAVKKSTREIITNLM